MRRLAVALAVGLTATIAHADPSDLVGRPIVLDRNQLEAQLVGQINVAPKRVWRPYSIAPDVWFGATPRLTLGLVHSDLAESQLASGAAWCFNVTDNINCDREYRGAGLDARYRVRDWLAPRARFVIHDRDPWKPQLLLGAALHWQRGRFAISGDPYLQLGLANRDQGNAAALFLPVQAAVQPACRWQVYLDTGWNAVLETWSDGWHIPLGLGVRVRAVSHLELATELGYRSLLGPLNTAKERTVYVTAGWRT